MTPECAKGREAERKAARSLRARGFKVTEYPERNRPGAPDLAATWAGGPKWGVRVTHIGKGEEPSLPRDERRRLGRIKETPVIAIVREKDAVEFRYLSNNQPVRFPQERRRRRERGIRRARQAIEQIGEEKRRKLEGGGQDFRGALKRLVGIWGDPGRALIELLQNADDAEATTVEYKMLATGLLFTHNGYPFTQQEVKAICSVDDTTKDAEKHTGFMGIGFKAVFRLSHSPFIFCPPWRFRFSPHGFPPNDYGWILVPRWVESIPPEVGQAPDGTTIFWLPYKKREQLSEGAVGRIEVDIFDRLDALCLMFLRNIRQIRIEMADGRTRRLGHERDAVVEEKGGEETRYRYTILRRLFEVPAEAKVELAVQDSGRDKVKVREIVLAFAQDSKGNLQLTTNSPLYTYLPTDCFPGLRFVIQGDFILDSQRSNVDESLEWNRWLWRCARHLLTGAIEGFVDDEGNQFEGFKNSERMRYQFYRVLPSRGDFDSTGGEGLMQTELIEPFWDYCRENPTIVTSSNAWVKPSEAVFASPDLQDFLDTEKLEGLAGRGHFVHPKVQGVKGLLLDLGVSALEEHEILDVLEDEDWLNSKHSQWFGKLYDFLWQRLYGDENRWTDWWKQEPRAQGLSVVRTAQGIVKNADEVFFPPASEKDAELFAGIPGVLFVDSSFLEGSPQKLLEKLGVRTLSAENLIRTAIVESFEDGTWQDWNEEQLDRCVAFVREWLKRRQWKPPADLARKLGAVRVRTEGGALERADHCYHPEQDLKLLFPEGNFAKLDETDEDQHEFLLALGVKDRPRVFLDEDERYQSYYGPESAPRWNGYWRWLEGENYLPRSTRYRKISGVSYLDGWDKLQSSPEMAEVMLAYLVRHWEGEYESYMESSYEYYHRTSKTEEVPSYFAWQLSEAKWVPTSRGLMQPSGEIFVPLPKIKRVAGDLVPYVSIPRGWKKQEFLVRGKEFFKSLDLRTELDMEALGHLLEVVQDKQVDGKARTSLSRIYRALGRLLEDDENGSELPKLQLLTEAGTFEDSASLHWNDDRDLGAYFQDAESLRFAWIPDGVERRYIEILFQRSGVRVVSKHARRELVRPITAEESEKWTDLLRRKAKYVYSLLKHHNADRADIAGEKLSKVRARSSDRIEVLIGLGGVEKTAVVDAFYDVDSDDFYVAQDPEDFEISLELARAFGLNLGHVADIEIILPQEDDMVAERLRRQGIALMDWETEQVLPGPEHQEEEARDQEEEATEERETEPFQEISTEEEEPVERDTTGRRVRRMGLPYDERMKREASNIERIIRFEEGQGRTAKDVSKEYRGFDIESIDKATDERRYIEVKASSHVALTPHEYEVADEEGSAYYLYVVDHDVLLVIQDPASSCRIEPIETLETRWRILGWRENALEYELWM